MKNLGLLLMVLTGGLITLFWDIPVLHSLKLLVVLVHEIWHGLTAMVLGGTLHEIRLSGSEEGETLVRGMESHIAFILTASAGYLGTTFTGAVFLNRGLSGSTERPILGLFTIMLWYMSYIFTEWGSSAFYTGMGGALVLTLVLLGGRRITQYVMVALGTMFIWYSFADTFDFAHNISRSDAGILAEYIIYHFAEYIPLTESVMSVVVSAIWTFLMVLMTYSALHKQFAFFLPGHSSTETMQNQNSPTIEKDEKIHPDGIRGETISS